MKQELHNFKHTIKDNTYHGVTYAVLKTIGTGGKVAGKSILKFITESYIPFLDDPPRHSFAGYRINFVARRLRKRGWIKLTRGASGLCYSLTPAGQTALCRYEMKDVQIKKPKRWDKKWRVVIFDVREKRKKHREAIRKMLINLGFKMLQESVWIFPYPCQEVIELAKTAYAVRRDAIYLLCERFGGDERLAFVFNIGLDPNG